MKIDTPTGTDAVAPVTHDSPTVTIGFPVYNGGNTFALALDSLLAQTYTDFELIISDNGSTDGTLEICREYERRDPRIRVIAQPKNQGALFNFKAVLEPARGRYFMWAAHDDIWMPGFIEVTTAELDRHQEACVCMSAVERFEEDGTVIDVMRFPMVNGASKQAMFNAVMSGKKMNFFIYGMFRTDVLQRGIEHFPEVLGGDRQFMCQFALSAPFRYVDKVLYRRLINRRHEQHQLLESVTPGVLRKQILAFGLMLLRSPLMSVRRKVECPYYAYRYAVYASTQAGRNRRRCAEESGRKHVERVRMSRKHLFFALACIASAVALFKIVSGDVIDGAVLLIALVLFGLQMQYIRAGRSIIDKGMLRMAKKMDRVDAALDISSLRQLSNDVRRITDLELMRNAAELGKPEISRDDLTRYAQNRLIEMERHINFAHQFEASRIRALYAGEIFPELAHIEVPVGVINEQSGHPNKTDMVYVAAIAKLIGAKRLFEFGTYMGRTTYHLTQASKDAQVYTLNIPLEQAGKYAKYIGKLFKGTDRENQIHQIFEDSFTFDTTPMKHSFDFVFVDADHGYEAVANDTRKAFELVRPGGVVMWHDYSPKSPGLLKAIREFTEQNRPLFRIRNTCLLLHIDGVDPMSFQPHALPDTLEAEHAVRDEHRIEEIYP